MILVFTKMTYKQIIYITVINTTQVIPTITASTTNPVNVVIIIRECSKRGGSFLPHLKHESLSSDSQKEDDCSIALTTCAGGLYGFAINFGPKGIY